ncbi:AAA family ATPase [Rhodopseudomonas palustris]|uniref:trifunctional serine/threonine-protein kinase/ATP-binding protein/sensor histidine kinase n=1 Tax=Rhodopseudomonas palustris TaxID=1076 RepID=UPI00115CA70B|nr:AAA family ATPase [Rhodopseudomonas palustris]QDL95978.1 AAA family ATPase [Rhodopseudomonas palustris]
MTDISAALELVTRCGDFGVYRVQEDRSPPRLLLIAEADEPCPLERAKRELALTRDLDPAIVVRPRALVSAQGRPALLIDDHGARPLSESLAEPLAVPKLLRRAIGMAHALGHIHERGLVHRHLRPDTVWVDDSDRVWLTGLGGASRSRRERRELALHEAPSGSPIYLSPEQTGRVNRSVDSRSDLYVLGIILYQMLSGGSLPFHASSPAQWIHQHIARRPHPLPTAGAATAAIERLVFRLLEKSADDRYQSAAGVERDLRACLAAWEVHGHTAGVRLTAHDAAGVVRMPEKLYGRDTEINAILSAYHRAASTGATEWALISGYSGAGKSSAVNELRKSLTPTNGWFIAGKFDQYKRDTPFATLAQAFHSLVRQILGQDAAAFEGWRSTLQAAVGEHGELMVNLVPDLALVIGDQPPLRSMSAQESRAAFQAVLGRFIAAIARPEHPLVLFLDDLQWLDRATADFLVRLADDIDTSHLLVIGAYRDNEIDDGHPLGLTLQSIRQRVPHIEEIRLAPLGQAHIRALVADVLRCESDQVAPLAALIHRKTGGNPFFAIQFFSSLINEQLVSFDVLNERWSWNVELIEGKGFTDNVVDLMSRRLDRLPPRTRAILRIFPCLGMAADAALLGRLCDIATEAVHDGLQELVAAELVLRTDEDYRFVHDRVREVAYRLIDPVELPAIHLEIARHLATSIPTRPDALFQIVDHYNLGAALIDSDAERLAVARLNREAGRAAMKAIAYGSAQAYLTTALALLGDSALECEPDLAFDVEYLIAECEFLTGAMAEAEARLQRLAPLAPTPHARSFVVALQVTLYTAIDRSDRAIETCLAYLRDFGIIWPQHPDRDQAKAEYRLLMERLGGRSIESLIDLPAITDQSRAAPMAVMSAALAPAFFTDLNLVCVLLCRMANISVQQGNCDASALAYAYLGMVVGPCFDDYDAAFRFGDLGLKLVETRGLGHYKARVHLTYGAHVLPWARPLHEAQPYLRRAFEEAVETGDLTYAGFSSCTLITNRLSAGDPLDDVEIEAVARLALMRRAKFGLIVHIITTQLQFLRSLRGDTTALGSLNGPDFDEAAFERELAANRSLDIAACWFWIRKMQASYFAGDQAAAFAALLRAEPLLWTTVGHHEYSIFHFYVGVICAALADSPNPPETRAALERRLAGAHLQMSGWEVHNPGNYKGATALLAAEIARLQDRPFEAMKLYQQAVSSSRRVRVSQVEAIAHELAAEFCRRQGFDTAYQAHLMKARDCYQQWGAAAKVEQLDRNHPDVAVNFPAAAQVPLGLAESFDLAAVVKTSEAVSNELGVPRLMETLMSLVLEHAGAERGLLILPQQAELTIRAEARTGGGGIQVTLRDDLATADDLPTTLVNLAARTGEAITIDDAGSSPFADDPYIARTASRSLLCLPLMKRNKLIAVIFLENDLAAGVFTPLKLSVLKLLSSQAAISLKNAFLEEKDALVEALQKSQSELMRMSRLTAIGELVISIAHEINQPLTAIITNADVCLRWLGNAQPSIAEARSAARRVIENGRRAADVVQTIRGLAVKAAPMMSAVDVNAVIREILSILQVELRQNAIHLETQLTESDATVAGNRVQLQQVLLNLCMNAIESMAAIEGRRTLTVASTTNDADGVVVTVADNGLGFDEDRIDQLFEALVTTKPQGMGMGLSISRSIVEAHGGRLWAIPVKPHGARFQFALPRPT